MFFQAGRLRVLFPLVQLIRCGMLWCRCFVPWEKQVQLACETGVAASNLKAKHTLEILDMQPHYPHDIPWLGDSRSWGIFRGIPGIFATHCRLEEDESDEGSEMEAEAEDPLPDFRMVRRFGKSLYQSLSPQTNSWIIDVAWTCPLNLPSTGLSDWFFEFLRSRQEEQPSGRKRSPEPQISTAFDSTRDAAQHSEVELLVGAKAGQRCKEFDSKIETQQFQSQRRFSQRRCRLEIHRIEHISIH